MAISGAAFDWDIAFARLVGEAVERYCGCTVDTTRVTEQDYVNIRDSAISPRSWIGYDPEHILPYAMKWKYSPTEIMSWCNAAVLGGNQELLVPARLVWLGFNPAHPGDNFHQTTSSGLAAGPSFESAVENALLELIERDALMSRWLLRAAPIPLSIEEVENEDLPEPLKGLMRSKYISVQLYDIGVGAPCHVILARVTSTRSASGFILGASAKFVRKEAIEKACTEAISLFVSFAMHGANRPLISTPRNIIDFVDHGYYYVHNVCDATTEQFFDNSFATPQPEMHRARRGVSDLVDYCNASDIPILTVDLTLPDMRERGWCVIRCLAPGLQPLTHGFGNHTTDCRRLAQVANALGLPKPTLASINTQVHPFA